MVRQLDRETLELQVSRPTVDMAEANVKSGLVSVIVSARDEAKYIGTLIHKIKDSLINVPYEIIVVNDGSQDSTGAIAREHGAIVISNSRSMGKGDAMKLGVKNALGEAVVFIDADGAHDPKDIMNLVTPILEGKSELVIGSRYIQRLKPVDGPMSRKISNRLASFVISVIISFILPVVALSDSPLKWRGVTDCTSGLRAIKKQSWQRLDLLSKGFQIETEMIFEAARNKLIITEVPISCNWFVDGSHLSIVHDGLSVLRLLAGKLFVNFKYKLRHKF